MHHVSNPCTHPPCAQPRSPRRPAGTRTLCSAPAQPRLRPSWVRCWSSCRRGRLQLRPPSLRWGLRGRMVACSCKPGKRQMGRRWGGAGLVLLTRGRGARGARGERLQGRAAVAHCPTLPLSLRRCTLEQMGGLRRWRALARGRRTRSSLQVGSPAVGHWRVNGNGVGQYLVVTAWWGHATLAACFGCCLVRGHGAMCHDDGPNPIIPEFAGESKQACVPPPASAHTAPACLPHLTPCPLPFYRRHQAPSWTSACGRARRTGT